MGGAWDQSLSPIMWRAIAEVMCRVQWGTRGYAQLFPKRSGETSGRRWCISGVLKNEQGFTRKPWERQL